VLRTPMKKKDVKIFGGFKKLSPKWALRPVQKKVVRSRRGGDLVRTNMERKEKKCTRTRPTHNFSVKGTPIQARRMAVIGGGIKEERKKNWITS